MKGTSDRNNWDVPFISSKDPVPAEDYCMGRSDEAGGVR